MWSDSFLWLGSIFITLFLPQICQSHLSSGIFYLFFLLPQILFSLIIMSSDLSSNVTSQKVFLKHLQGKSAEPHPNSFSWLHLSLSGLLNCLCVCCLPYYGIYSIGTRFCLLLNLSPQESNSYVADTQQLCFEEVKGYFVPRRERMWKRKGRCQLFFKI